LKIKVLNWKLLGIKALFLLPLTLSFLTLAAGSAFGAAKPSSQKSNPPPAHPFLMANSVYPMIHWNAQATDVTSIESWTGNHKVSPQQVQWIPMPPSNVGTAHYPYPDGEQALIFSGNNSVSKLRITNGALELISQVKIPGYEVMNATEKEIRDLVKTLDTTNEDVFLPAIQAYSKKHGATGETLAYGVYTLLDKDGNYYAGWGTTVYKIADETPGDINSPLKIVASYDLKDGLPADKAAKISRLLGLNMTYDGNIVVGMPGLVAVLDRDFKAMEYVFFEGEAIDNGVTVDDKDGIYVVTSKYMRKVIWNGKTLSDNEADGAWKSEYDYVPNPRAFSRGAGNTPTLMGFGPDEDHLIIICDAGDPVKIVAMWRDKIPEDFQQKPGAKSRRIADQKALTIKVPATIEWSPHVNGYGAMMFASAWPDPVDVDGKLDIYSTVLSAGVSREAPTGSEKFIWDPESRTLSSAWTTEIGMQWALHPVSSKSNTVHLAELKNGVYSLVGVDWTSGKEVGRTELGTSPIFNTMGGFYILLDNGDLFVTSAFGAVRISKMQ
jgi:hypothetical protein